MFCMNCGQKLPDSAKFCIKCGTSAGFTSPIESAGLSDENGGGTQVFVPALCPNCNAHMDVDPSTKITRCESCGTECLIQDAIKELSIKGNVQVEGGIQVGNATIIVGGKNSESLLQRIEIMLKDGEFSAAQKKCDEVLDLDPTNGLVYLYILMARLGCKKREEISMQNKALECEESYYKILKYGDDNLKEEIASYKKDVDARIEEMMKNPQIGDEIYLGTKNGLRIGWTVISIASDRKSLGLLCSQGICEMPFDKEPSFSTSWEHSSLRKWLNNEFYNDCFTPEEQSKIITMNLAQNDIHNRYTNNTEDKVLLPTFALLSWLCENKPNHFVLNIEKPILSSLFNSHTETVTCMNTDGNEIFIDVKQNFTIRPFLRINIEA